MTSRPPRASLRELTDDEYKQLDFAHVRCNTCTPCCTRHTHFLYRGQVLWACQSKLKEHLEEKKPADSRSTDPVTTERERHMTTPIDLTLPLSREDVACLRAGDEVTLSGPVYTMRDAGHTRALAALERTGKLPFGLEGATLFYAGPTPAAAGRPLGSVGPTTASRMDFATPALMRAGIVGCIGKGKRSPKVVEACRATGSVYFATVGGIAALLATHVISSELVAWEDLDTEALRRLEVRDLPAFVAIDTHGADLYRSIEEAAQ